MVILDLRDPSQDETGLLDLDTLLGDPLPGTVGVLLRTAAVAGALHLEHFGSAYGLDSEGPGESWLDDHVVRGEVVDRRMP